MHKMTRVFELVPVTSPVFAVNITSKRNGMDNFYPIAEDNTVIFVRGLGRIKIGKREHAKKIRVANLSPDFTSVDLQNVWKEYGPYVVWGLLATKHNPACSLFQDSSIYLEQAKMELVNIGVHGAKYDEFIVAFQQISDKYVLNLLQRHGFRMDDGYLYRGTKLVMRNGDDIYENQLSPMKFVSHWVTRFHCQPHFDPLAFDTSLEKLIKEAFENGNEILAKHVSVASRIEFLAGNESAREIAGVFDLQKKFFGK